MSWPVARLDAIAAVFTSQLYSKNLMKEIPMPGTVWFERLSLMLHWKAGLGVSPISSEYHD